MSIAMNCFELITNEKIKLKFKNGYQEFWLQKPIPQLLRLAYLIIETNWFDIEFINVHVSKKNKTQQEKEDLYRKIELILEDTSNSKIKIVLGYVNAQIGKEILFRPQLI